MSDVTSFSLTRVPGVPSIVMTEFDLTPHGYVREEWFISGEAAAYTATGQPRHGRWEATAGPARQYTTRVVVVRPSSGAAFDGTVVVEWLNVSGGRDAGPDWLFAHREIMRRGSAWVGVTAQRAGIDGGGLREDLHLRLADSDRYAPLEHPGDAYAFDIFGDAVHAVRTGGLLGDLPAPAEGLRVLAMGESQAAIFLVTYLNAIDPHHQLVDGALLHGRSARGAWLDGTLWDVRRLVTESVGRVGRPGHLVRADVRVPVLEVQSETDVFLMGSVLARQEDTESFRLWEIAGAAHFDMYALKAAYVDDGSLTPQRLADLLQPVVSPRGFRTTLPVNGGPHQHYVLQAALRALGDWSAHRSRPAEAPRLRTRLVPHVGLARDRYGLAQGGVRTPFVDVPASVLSGFGQRAAGFGMLFGSTRPLTTAQLGSRYAGGQTQYDEEFAEATHGAVAAGFLLPDDTEEILALGHLAWPG
jgi:Alpha/beta hydrolase domain